MQFLNIADLPEILVGFTLLGVCFGTLIGWVLAKWDARQLHRKKSLRVAADHSRREMERIKAEHMNASNFDWFVRSSRV